MDLPITPTLSVPGHELRWYAVRSTGPGGQNVSKVATKVELRFSVAESSLPGGVRQRLAARERNRINAAGELVLSSDETRSQTQNLALVRQRLAELIREALVPPKRRRPTRPTRAAVARRLEAKSHQKQKKAARRPPSE